MTGRPEPEYRSAFISVAGDCPATRSREPDKPGTIGALEFDLIAGAPYRYTQADVLWHVHVQRGGLGTREEFFSRPMACLRASPLGKTLGWGLHFDAEGRVALVARDSADYERLASDPTLVHWNAMRNKRA